MACRSVHLRLSLLVGLVLVCLLSAGRAWGRSPGFPGAEAPLPPMALADLLDEVAASQQARAEELALIEETEAILASVRRRAPERAALEEQVQVALWSYLDEVESDRDFLVETSASSAVRARARLSEQLSTPEDFNAAVTELVACRPTPSTIALVEYAAFLELSAQIDRLYPDAGRGVLVVAPQVDLVGVEAAVALLEATATGAVGSDDVCRAWDALVSSDRAAWMLAEVGGAVARW